MMQHLSFRKRGALLWLVMASFVMADPAAAAGDGPVIRPYANGAGPAAIFRFGRQEDLKRDVFAVVDPALWRIQFFTLDDLSSDGRSFAQRFTKRGDCALLPSFRMWRVHQHESRVVLQSQPTVPVGALIHDGRPKALTFRALTLPATRADIDRVAAGTATPDDKKPGNPCSPVADVGQLPDFTASDAAVTVTGGASIPFAVSRTSASRELGNFGRKKLFFAVKGRYLVSAQEIEHGRRKDVTFRHVLLTTRTEKAGFVSTEVVLVRRSERETVGQRMQINLGLSRVKMGLRNIAISSTGEVLLMGATDKTQFRVHLCAFDGNKKDTPCSIKDDDTNPPGDVMAGQPTNEPAVTAPPTPPRAAELWRQAFNYSEQSYTVDIGSLPSNCTRLRKDEKTTASCNIAGAFPWTPLSELRLAEGLIERKGVPYAQNGERIADARPNFTSKDLPGPPIRKPLQDTNASPPFVFGDIENDDDTISGNIRVFGIDCSAFLSKLWGFTERVDTKGFRDRANAGTDDHISRVRAIDRAQIGDAFVIRITHVVDNKPKTLLNHIVLFQDDERPSGPTDSSRAILVVESSSSCGGVCWSFYDESFFHGWGIIRREKSQSPPQNLKLIPKNIEEWQQLFAPS